MQVILQATHAVVSVAAECLNGAFGDNEQEFEALLLRPHHFIFNRVWYDELDGRAEFDEYLAEMRTLSDSEKEELVVTLSMNDKREYASAKKFLSSAKLRSIMNYYLPISRPEEQRIWKKQKVRLKARALEQINVPDDERVEDAGLEIAA